MTDKLSKIKDTGLRQEPTRVRFNEVSLRRDVQYRNIPLLPSQGKRSKGLRFCSKRTEHKGSSTDGAGTCVRELLVRDLRVARVQRPHVGGSGQSKELGIVVERTLIEVWL